MKTVIKKKRELINKRCSYQFQESAYTIKTKKHIQEWLEDFEKVRTQILKSQDSNKSNYDFEQFNLQEQEEITVVYWRGEIVAFSSLFNRAYYPKDLSRCLNRMWKSPKIRFLTEHYRIHLIMLSYQFQKAVSLKKNGVFISVQGKRNWLNLLTDYLKEKDERWVCCEEQYKVAPGKDESCWQYVAYLALKPGYKLKFPHRKNL